jgi:hypothetical protein
LRNQGLGKMCWGNRKLPLEGFYGAISLIAGSAIVFLYTAIWKKAEDRIKDLNGKEGQEAKIWLGDIWTTDIKQGVQDFYSYIQTSLAELESSEEFKFEELFAHTGKTPVLRKKLQDLASLFRGYLDSRNLLRKSRQGHENMKKWILRTILSLFSIAVWGALGFLVDNTFLSDYTVIFWLSLVPLLLFLSAFSFKLAKTYSNCCRIDTRITNEKSKHPEALEVVL